MFSSADLELVRWTCARFRQLSRTELALTICENLGWTAPNGQMRVQACLPLLEGLAAAGVVTLPHKQPRRPYRPARPRAAPLPPVEVSGTLRDLGPVRVEPVLAEAQAMWDATMAAEHPLGFQRAFGAHQRYWIVAEREGRRMILGGLLFAAAALHVAARDAALGWSRAERQRYRHRLVSNSRFLIRSGVHVPHLASHALGLALRRLRRDWQGRFGYEPVVVESYVTAPWSGTCYRAANWLHVGATSGSGRQDRRYAEPGTVRQVFLRPLVRDWQRALVAPEPAAGAPPEGEVDMRTAEQAFQEMSEEGIRKRWADVVPFLDEKQRRLLAAAEARSYGPGGVERVAALVGLSPATVRIGVRELEHPEAIQPERIRRPGGGRKRAVEHDPTLLRDLEDLVSPETRGDPESPLRWTSKSTSKLTEELRSRGHRVGHTVVGELLHELGYSLQATRKVREGTEHQDRDAQFRHIQSMVEAHQSRGQPVISVDTKKKEMVGDFKNAGTEWQPKGHPEEVRVHDFVLPELGKVSPYGVYDVARNEAWVSVGIDHDTATFAVASIRNWWQSMGREAYPEATELLITADGGGSNGSRVRLWKLELQALADATGLAISVCHFPPGTSKWNKIEHRLFSHITQNWRGRPLSSHEAIVSLIAHTTTATGLKVQCELDTNPYPKGVRVADEELEGLEITRSDFHPEWNYTLHPRSAR